MEASSSACPYWVKFLLGIFAALIFLGGFGFLLLAVLPAETLYSVAIASASGLDPASPTDLWTIRSSTSPTASSNSFRRRTCMDAGTYVEVSYRCVPLVASAATPRRICVAPRKSKEETIVARGAAIRLPGYMMDSLVADIQSRVEAFGVVFKPSHGNFSVAECDARQVGDDTGRCY